MSDGDGQFGLPFDDGVLAGLKAYAGRFGMLFLLLAFNAMVLCLLWSAVLFPLQTAFFGVGIIVCVLAYLLYQTNLRQRLWVRERVRSAMGNQESLPRGISLLSILFARHTDAKDKAYRDISSQIKRITIEEINQNLERRGAQVKLDSDGNPIMTPKVKGVGQGSI
ncbi:MAG TPA: hypothetical protein VFT65_08055 [Candidatus Angelobacter sp.]|nr:hypothetical protein [Candidatus Angelobacter sp.]